ncbi:SAV_2336 N-terminal domain-related protein [Streptomyces sp. NBC_01549]|uniref:SAV_2336 N-terminal domain-related protein n=1 Tax=unclassified Streptomyces TaxID=2593676 RepID=UPI00225B380E|nr:SAV_2336 N-terminal domain-related protein [Streptomyces sp. NBC_01549]MCX4596873.1 SAV_2336 N-terminal domain-related protein [Streptomyces sp. NBC_01549]
MIEELFEALEESGANAGPEELAEILWLAARIDGAGIHMPDGLRGAPHGESAPPPGALESSSTAGAGDPRPAEQFYSAADVADASASAARNVDLVRIRRAASVHDPLAVMRALRPLGRPTGVPGDIARSELDEELTVRSTIEQCLPVPVFRPRRGRWLDLALVVDTHNSMLLWHDLVTELRRVVAQSGIFRDVRTWYLSGTGQHDAPCVARAGGEPRSVQEITDPSGHRLVLVVTDTVSGGWGASGLRDVLRHWASHGPVALLNVLPRRLWDRGAVRPQPYLVRAPRPAAPNTSWRLGHAAGSRRRHRDRAALDESIAIPVVEASPDSMSALAELVAGGGRWSSLPCLTIPRRPEGQRMPRPDPPRPTLEPPVAVDESLRRFRAGASPLAQTLAGYLSAVPLNLPVMNLVRQIMLPKSDPGHLAEVALGGLFEPWEHEASGMRADLERMPFRFRAGVREALLGSQRRDKITAVQEVVRREMGAYVTERGSGPAGDFLAARGAAGEDGSRTMAQDALPFADRASTPSPVGRPVREVLAPYKGHPLPPERDVDAQLRGAIHRAINGGSSLVLLVGEPGSGKTYATTRALRQIPDDWSAWSPDLSLTLNRGAPLVGPRTVVMLSDLEKYTTTPGFPIEAMARVVRDLIEDTERAPVIVLGMLTPSAWDSLVAMAQQSPPGDYENCRHLIARAEVIRVHPVDAADAASQRWPGEPSRTRLVMIASARDPVRAGSKFDHLGTGFLLGPRLVLTAARILDRRSPSWTVKVRNSPGTVTADAWVDCRVLWRHDTYDAALLLTEHDLAEDATDSHFSTPRWAQPSSEPLTPCHITGVTVASAASPQASGYLTGTLLPTSSHPDAPYDFEPATALPQPGSFARGMSGAPVFFGEFLLGLVVARTDRSRRPHLTVASIATLASDPAFTEVCSQYMPRVPRLNLLPSSAPAGDGRTSDGPAAGPRPPRVFISYAHEDDNGARAQQVRSLGQVLRAEGIDVRLDHIDAEVSRDWTAWMRQEIETADVILVIASPAYKRRAEGPEADLSAGVAFEARLLRSELAHTPADGSQRILPVLLPGSTSEDLPAFLRPLHPLVIDPTTRTGAEQLLNRLVPAWHFFKSVPPEMRMTMRRLPAVLTARHALEVAHGLTRALDSAVACNPAGIRDFEHADELDHPLGLAEELARSGLDLPKMLTRSLKRGQDLLDDVRHGLRHLNDPLSPTDRGEFMDAVNALADTITGAHQLAEDFVVACTSQLRNTIGQALRREPPELDEELLHKILDDFTNVDLTNSDLTGIDMVRVRWSPLTRWPATLDVEELKARSSESAPGSGVYIVRLGTVGDR